MARLTTLPLSWNPVLDAVSYRVYILPEISSDTVEDDVLTGFFYENPYSEVPNVIGDDGRISVDVGALNVTPEVEGTYDVYVTALDENGNESDPAVLDDARFDFTPPLAPTDLRLG